MSWNPSQSSRKPWPASDLVIVGVKSRRRIESRRYFREWEVAKKRWQSPKWASEGPMSSHGTRRVKPNRVMSQENGDRIFYRMGGCKEAMAITEMGERGAHVKSIWEIFEKIKNRSEGDVSVGL